MRARIWRILDHIVAEHLDRAGAGQQQGGEYLDERGLARAVRTEQAEKLALLDLQGHVVERVGGTFPFAPERPGDVIDLYGETHGLTMVDAFEEYRVQFCWFCQ